MARGPYSQVRTDWPEVFFISGNDMLRVTGAADGTARLWLVESNDGLLSRACDWLQAYLRHHAKGRDRTLCKRIPQTKHAPSTPQIPPNNEIPANKIRQ